MEQYGDLFHLERIIPSYRNNQGTCVREKVSRIIDPEGNFFGILESIRDIGEMKNAHESLMRMKEEIETSLNERISQITERIEKDYPGITRQGA